MERGQVVSFEMLMIATIMLVVMGLILPKLVMVKEIVTEGENRQLAEKYLNSIANRAEMVYVMGEGAVMYEFIHTSSRIELWGSGNRIEVRAGDFSKERNVSAKIEEFVLNISGDARIRITSAGESVQISSSP